MVRIRRHAATHGSAGAERRGSHPAADQPVATAARGRRYALANARTTCNQCAVSRGPRSRAGTRRRTPASAPAGEFNAEVFGGQQPLWRDFDTLAREDGELHASGAYDSEHFSIGLEVAAVADPDDGDELRLDGSHATAQLGNWLLSANALDRWWGPGHEGSLILSNNARPCPRSWWTARARAFRNQLAELARALAHELRHQPDGERARRHRLTAVHGLARHRDALQGHRARASRAPRSSAARSWSAISKCSATCSPATTTSASMRRRERARQPDGRLRHPLEFAHRQPAIRPLRSVYRRRRVVAICRRSTSGNWASRSGTRAWTADCCRSSPNTRHTTCSANSSRGPYYNCAYNQGRFDVEGYRYRGRVIGYTSDRDAENYALGAIYTAADGALWTATARAVTTQSR